MVEWGRPINSPRIRSEIPRSRATSCQVRGDSVVATFCSITCYLGTVSRGCQYTSLAIGANVGAQVFTGCTAERASKVEIALGDKAGGERLAKVLRVAMASAGIETWLKLSLASDVSPTTIDNWIYGVTTPRAHHLGKVGRALHPYTSGAELERVYAGLAPEEPPIIDALRDIAPELHELVLLLRAQADQAVLAAVQTALEESRRRRIEARAAPTSPQPQDRK